ncbi:ribonuclease h : Ribonuclease H OS=Pseudonocardia dioxanivorans (strain ATCC 55486 / DSM 44775 / JCM 13855 / CB1190) GN=Psed_2488 PE=4 SV=1: RNase_H [Gemmata massiliana]|uniref:RNase H type-1 domain-containing protein n=1 Tax=Gemmata massiliana TaxID=1210884 RepID=A0A6P2D1A9_9BACT|nr:hypothetical protein [Gemmata massiliana]VTR95118.1 ribonuclease h : Ribonuclease H OS=Pseudonocardia dioxanivorans (strain ATCC 55486 / DSM 44775 / JCM 13855 / CB1190) GN=Psed_2488 PE=4 SV=1: RNase_H [Gemmata massiliana]
MAERTEIHTDGTFNDQTGVGGWAAVVARTSTGWQEGTSSYEMEPRAIVEAVKLAEGPCTVVSDHEGIIGLARDGRTPRMCRSLWDELYATATGKDIVFEWKKRDQSLGSRLAHQLSRGAAKGR